MVCLEPVNFDGAGKTLVLTMTKGRGGVTNLGFMPSVFERNSKTLLR